MKITIEGNEKEINALLTLAVPTERLIDQKITECNQRFVDGFSKIKIPDIEFFQKLQKEVDDSKQAPR